MSNISLILSKLRVSTNYDCIYNSGFFSDIISEAHSQAITLISLYFLVKLTLDDSSISSVTDEINYNFAIVYLIKSSV